MKHTGVTVHVGNLFIYIEAGNYDPYGCEAAPQPEGASVCAQQAPARLGFPGALPQRRVVWMWFGAFPGVAQLVRNLPAMQGILV